MFFRRLIQPKVVGGLLPLIKLLSVRNRADVPNASGVSGASLLPFAKRGFHPFSLQDEEELVRTLSTKPRHVARRVRQLAFGTHKRIHQFRNTVTYLMLVLQGKLQRKEMEPAMVSSVMEDIMRECVVLKQRDLAHLLFRAAIRFRKYGMGVSVRCVQLLFESYRTAGARELLKNLAEELKPQPELAPIAICALVFAGEVNEALEMQKALPTKLSTADLQTVIAGLGQVERWDCIESMVASVVQQKDDSASALLSAAVVATYPNATVQDRLYREATKNHIALTEKAVGAAYRARLAATTTLQQIHEAEEAMKQELHIADLGPTAAAAAIGRCTYLISKGLAHGDNVMLSKIQHLEAVIDAQLTNEEVADIEPIHVKSLIRGYGVLGRVADVGKIFRHVQQVAPSLVDHRLYEEVMRWQAHANNVKEVLHLKQEMEEQNLFHVPMVYVHLFRVLGRFYPRMVSKYYHEMRTRGTMIDKKLYAQLLATFTDLGELSRVEELYEEMKKKALAGGDVFTPHSIGVLIKAFRDNPTKGEEVISRGVRCGHMVSEEVQSAAVGFYALNKMEKELQKLLESLPTKRANVFGALLRYYMRTNDRKRFDGVAEELRRSGVVMTDVIYGALIRGYAHWKDAEKAKALLAESKESSAIRECKFFATVATAFADLGDYELVDSAWQDMRAANIPVSMATYNRFLELYMGRNDVDRMSVVLKDMMERIPANPVTTTTIIDMLAKMGRLSEMEAVFEEMRKSPDVSPTLVTYHQAMNAYAKSGDVVKMEGVRKRIQEAGMSENAITYNILAEGYGRAKRFEHLADLVRERLKKGVVMEETGFVVLLSIYSRAKLGLDIDRVVRMILDSKAVLTQRLLGAIASAYSTVRDSAKVGHYVSLLLSQKELSQHSIDTACLVFARMSDVANLEELIQKRKPSEHACNICVTTFARCGEYGKVASVLQLMDKESMVLSVNAALTLSSLLLKAGKVDLAQSVLKWGNDRSAGSGVRNDVLSAMATVGVVSRPQENPKQNDCRNVAKEGAA